MSQCCGSAYQNRGLIPYPPPEGQVRYFSRRYQVITYNARGYPPSDVPETVDAYSQEQATDDIVGLMRHLGIAQAPGGTVDGGLCRPALWAAVPHPGALPRSGWLWLRLGGERTSGASSRTRPRWPNASNAMGCAPWPPCIRRGPRAYSSKTKILEAGENLPTSWLSIPIPAQRAPCAGGTRATA